MKIVTLIENLTYKSDLTAEHGLSIYIDTGSKKLLFDTGLSSNFMVNAQKLGIDIKEIDCVIISHGHFDHTGGLYAFLEKNDKAKVYIKQEAFVPKHRSDGSFIGVEYRAEALDGRVTFVNQTCEIDNGVFIVADIPVKNPADTHYEKLKITRNGTLHNDEFEDELFLALISNNKLNIVSSCSHRGITNIVARAREIFDLPLNLILGGFHTKECSNEQHAEILQYIQRTEPAMIGVCHCTGVDEFARLQNQSSCKVFYNYTGNVISVK
jgi:7,8-dihydropterin-6-yl-methyl-4-(beta-D-ribofuranosyl)aminobenzene 5'-phosphate synthase